MIKITVVCMRCKKDETLEFEDRDDASYFVSGIIDEYLCKKCKEAYKELVEGLEKASSKAKEEFFKCKP